MRELGIIEAMTGGGPVGAVTVNGTALETRPSTVTMIITKPEDIPTGTAALMLNTVELKTGAAIPLKLTILCAGMGLKAVPVMVISRVGGPDEGSIAAMVGGVGSIV